MNVIISGSSDSYALSSDGFESFYRAIGFGIGSCAGRSSNDTQKANLGDGNGAVVQAGIARWGSGCVESLVGGNHFRYWMQNGTKAQTNAVFLATSVEMPIKQNHMIVPNGYDMGRDQLVGNATQGTKTDSDTGNQFQTTVLSSDTSLMKGVSANTLNHHIGTDGTVQVLQVKLTKRGSGPVSQDANSGARGTASYSPSWPLVALFVALAPTVLLS